MRVTFIFAAATLAMAGPALAQATNAADANAAVVADNMTAADNTALADNVVVDNTIAADTMPIEEDAAPAPAPKKNFPWGLLGLIGLVGLLGGRRS